MSYDDLDAVVQQAVAHFPVIPDDWLDIDFSALPNPATADADAAAAATATAPYDSRSSSSFSAAAAAAAAARPRPATDYRGYSFRFLIDFTSRTGLVSSFECASLAQRQQIVSSFHQSYLEQQHPEFLGAIPPLPTPSEDPLNPVPPDHGLSPWSSWLHNPIVIKLQQVVVLVKNVVTVKPNNSTVTLTWSPSLEQRCLDFFSPPRFAKFIELYWSVWHPNVNIIHRPSFDPTSCKSILLAAMALIGKSPVFPCIPVFLFWMESDDDTGACVSPDPVDNEDAKMWFNCVEEMVFTDDDFCRDIDPPQPGDSTPLSVNTPANRRKLQALQASYIVCLYQNWEGTDASKRRIRRHRFGTVVSVSSRAAASFSGSSSSSSSSSFPFSPRYPSLVSSPLFLLLDPIPPGSLDARRTRLQETWASIRPDTSSTARCPSMSSIGANMS